MNLARGLWSRNTWTCDEIKLIYDSPLLDLVFRAANVHRYHFKPNEVVHQSTQSQHHKTELKTVQALAAAARAKADGFCMGAALHNKHAFDEVLKMVRGVKVIRMAFDDRLKTDDLQVCMGESQQDRIGMLHGLSTQEKHPESVLVQVEESPVTWDELVRMVATARTIMPYTVVCLSGGRKEFPESAQALMFLAGANSISGEKLLTADDEKMFRVLGLRKKQV